MAAMSKHRMLMNTRFPCRDVPTGTCIESLTLNFQNPSDVVYPRYDLSTMKARTRDMNVWYGETNATWLVGWFRFQWFNTCSSLE
mmetsp:Transcript_26857/g.65272  ORF Transcript_26857/g.65272 Transcript_26857/m.65272 type:complete len:85 (-) Transcript_26857:1628-1882(-)